MSRQFYSEVYTGGNENIHPHKALYTMFTAALFIVAERWKQTKCPSTDEHVNTSIQQNVIQLQKETKYSYMLQPG